MSGFMCSLLGATGLGVINPLNVNSASTATGAGSSTATVAFWNDGTVHETHTGISGTTRTVNWFSGAPFTGIGSNYWIQFDAGAWASLASTQQVSLTGTNNTASHAVAISTDSGGASIVATGTISLSVGNGA